MLDAALTAAARQQGVLRWTLWDASSRHLCASLDAGASGVVASPLSHFPIPFPDRTLSALQPAIDAVQSQMDQLPTRDARSQLLHALARQDAVSEEAETKLCNRTADHTGGSKR